MPHEYMGMGYNQYGSYCLISYETFLPPSYDKP